MDYKIKYFKYKMKYLKLKKKFVGGDLFCNMEYNPSNDEIKTKNSLEKLNLICLSFTKPCPSGEFSKNNREWSKENQLDNEYLKGLKKWITFLEDYNKNNIRLILRIYCSPSEYEYLKTYLSEISLPYIQFVIYTCPEYLDTKCEFENYHINLFGKLARYLVLTDKDVNKAYIRDGDIKDIDEGYKSIEKYENYDNTFTFGAYHNKGWGSIDFNTIFTNPSYIWNSNGIDVSDEIKEYLLNSNSIIGEYNYTNNWASDVEYNKFINFFNNILKMEEFNYSCQHAKHHRTDNNCCQDGENKFLYCADAMFNHRIVIWLLENHIDKITFTPLYM